MHGLGLLPALMEVRGEGSTTERPDPAPDEAVEPLDEGTFDAWEAWARTERRRWADPHRGPEVHHGERSTAPALVPSDRGVLGRI